MARQALQICIFFLFLQLAQSYHKISFFSRMLNILQLLNQSAISEIITRVPQATSLCNFRYHRLEQFDKLKCLITRFIAFWGLCLCSNTGEPFPGHSIQSVYTLKFSKRRRDSMNLVPKRLGESFEDNVDSNLITIKFCSYVLVTSNNQPEACDFNFWATLD